MPQLLNKNIFLIWKIKLLWFTDNEYENKVQNVFAKETHVLRGNNLLDFANTFTALKVHLTPNFLFAWLKYPLSI